MACNSTSLHDTQHLLLAPQQKTEHRRTGKSRDIFEKRLFVKPKELPEIFETTIFNSQDTDSSLPIDYFKKYFGEDFFEQLAVKSNENNEKLNTSAQEIKAFVGIHILQMINNNTSKFTDHWKLEFIKSSRPCWLRLRRMFKLRNHLRIVDVQERNKKTNKVQEIQPIIDRIKNKLRLIPRDSTKYSICQHSIHFYGLCPVNILSSKRKTINLLTLISDKGKILDITIQQERSPISSVLELCKTIPLYSQVFIDKEITSIQLLVELRKNFIFATGELDDIDKVNKWISDFSRVIGQLRDGQYVEYTKKDNKVCLVALFDSNSPRVFISTYYGSDDSETQIPEILHYYDSYFSNTIKKFFDFYKDVAIIRKWSVKIILHIFYLVTFNCWMEYVSERNAMTIHDYIISIGKSLLTEYKSDQKVDKRTLAPPLKRDKRNPKNRNVLIDGQMHYAVPQKIQQKLCRLPGCRKRTKVMCVQCKIFLCYTKHRQCFNKFHGYNE